ncbi:uncharacterized protein JCM6883_006783 [Sporobolomyces salmoneus]|uniref:uncharacterized protein n=1 Tax=Sporobolomyces salmoneus TaxID=183962 RepID=UPI003172A107
MTTTRPFNDWPWNEDRSARRLELVDKKGAQTHTTAAALLNSAFAQGQYQRKKGSSEKGVIFRGRTAIALYYLSVDLAGHGPSVTKPRAVFHDDHLDGLIPLPDADAYQEALHEEYPQLFASGLLQEMMLVPGAGTIDVYTQAKSTQKPHPTLVSQELGVTKQVGKISISIQYRSRSFPYLSPTTSQTTLLSFPPLSTQKHLLSHSSHSPVSKDDEIHLLVPCYPLLFIETAHSVAKFLKELSHSLPTKSFSNPFSLDEFVLRCRNTRRNPEYAAQLQQFERFFNLSFVMELRHFTHLSTQDSDLELYGRRHMTPSIRQLVEESLEAFQLLDEKFAIVVSREEARWPRWIKTTVESDHHNVNIGDAAKKRWEEWGEVKRLLKILVQSKSLEAHVPVSRQNLTV